MTLQAQSFATVVFADAKLERIRAVAANLGAVTGVEAEKALGEDVAAILGLHATHSCRNALGYPHIDGVPEVIPFTGSNGRRLEASVHSIADGAAIEIADSLVNPRSHNLLARFAAMAPSLANLPAATADAVRGAAGCDQAIALGPGGEPSAIASLGAVGAEDALQSLMERDAAFEVLRDVEAPLIELRGEDNRWAAPLVLTLSHSEALVRFARAIGARGAVFVRASSVAVVAWSAQPLVVSFGMAQAIGLIAKFADQAAHSVETSERSQRLTLMSDILILEDDRQLSRRWKDALTGAGHNVTVVESATDAISVALERVIDLCIVDIFIQRDGVYVPDGGVILISKFRQMHPAETPPWWRHVPIIAVTGASGISGGFDPLRTARDMGANVRMRKPIPLSELLQCVEDLLHEAETREADADLSA